MAKKARNEIAAGIFVVLGLATALGVVLWLTPALFVKPVDRTYFCRPHSAGPAGLRGGSVVYLGDLKIGQIAYLTDQPEQNRTLYVVDLFRKVSFYDNGVAEVPFVLVGDMTLSVKGPGDANGHLASEAYPMPITGGISAITDSLNKSTQSLSDQLDANRPSSLISVLNSSLGDVKAITVSIRLELDPNREQSLMRVIKDAAAHVHDIADKLVLAAAGVQGEMDPNRPASILATVSRIFTGAEPKVSDALTDVRATAGAIRGYTEKDVRELLAGLHAISGDVGKASSNLADLTEKAKGLVDRNSGSVDEMVQNLVLVSASLKATAAEVRRNPWRLLYKPDEKELNSANIMDAARAFSAGATQIDETVTRLGAIDPKTVSPEELKKLHDGLQEVIEKFTKAQQSLFKELGKDK
jgi:ABC-type transporter Mla subunit MlaD